jgi:hypothetical protein
MAGMDRRRVATILLPPLAAWSLSTAAVFGACVWAGASPWQAKPWVHGDGGLYLQIARHGYVLYRCGIDWCGDTGWFPALPWLAAALHVTGLSVVAAGVAIAMLFHWATLQLLWVTFLGRQFTFGSLGALVFAAFVPGLVFHETFFPLSLLAFFTLLHLWLLLRGRWVGAGLAGAAAVLAYPEGIILALTSAVWLLTQPGPLRGRLRAIAASSGLTAAGLGVFLLDQRLEVGRWNAYLLAQRKYEHVLEQPFAQLENALSILHHHSPFAVTTIIPVQKTFGITTVTADETVVVAVLLACGLAAIALQRPLDPLGLLLAIWAIGFWMIPQLESEVQSYRIEAALLPLALFLPRLPRPLVALFVLLAIAVSVPVARLQFQGWLV